MKELLPYLALLISAVACAVSIITLIRSGRWRDSDAAKALLERVDETESRLDKLEPKVDGLASKADIGGLKGELHAICKLVDDTVVPGLRRIEGYMMERTK